MRARWWLLAGALLLVVGVAPVATTMLAAWVANAHGCRLDEGDVHPCVVLGADRGAAVYAMGVAFWLELLTIWLVPAGLVLLVIGAARAWRGRASA